MSQSDAPGDDEQAARPGSANAAGPSATPGSTPPVAARSADREPARGARVGIVVGGAGLLVGLGAGALAAFFGWQHAALYESFTAADGTAEQAAARVAARLGAVEDALDDMEERLAGAADARAALESRLDEAPGRLAELERRVAAIAGGTGAARDRWLRAEAEYYLELANAELTLAADWDGALAALALADTRLRELSDPRLTGVRDAIAEERLALESVERPDVEGLAVRLGRLAERSATLPLRGTGTLDGAAERAAPAGEAEPGVGRLWSGVQRALSSLVRIERREEPVAQALTADEQRVVRRRVALNLDLARTALVRREPAVFATSLATARALLMREFDTRAPAVTAALTELAEIAATDIAPPRPDIGGSLARLRALSAEAR